MLFVFIRKNKKKKTLLYHRELSIIWTSIFLFLSVDTAKCEKRSIFSPQLVVKCFYSSRADQIHSCELTTCTHRRCKYARVTRLFLPSEQYKQLVWHLSSEVHKIESALTLQRNKVLSLFSSRNSLCFCCYTLSSAALPYGFL